MSSQVKFLFKCNGFCLHQMNTELLLGCVTFTAAGVHECGFCPWRRREDGEQLALGV